MNYWQIAAGDGNRNYIDLCLKWEVVLIGPGSDGPWPECREALQKFVGTRKTNLIRKFCEFIKPNDIVILRLGTAEVFGVGRVIGDYEWKDSFSDVDGWDLQHVRRIKWFWKAGRDTNQPRASLKPKKFPTHAMKWGDTVQTLNPGEVMDWVNTIAGNTHSINGPVKQLPAQGNPIGINEIANKLFNHGMGSASLSNLSTQINDVKRLAGWYRQNDNPSESETIAHIVVPLLRALGWTPQRMAIEWNRIDIALFEIVPPRDDSTLKAVVEAKSIDSSCLTAQSQATSYAEKPGREACYRVIVTDGLRYGVFLRQGDGKFKNSPDAYLNLNDFLSDYPILSCGGAADAMFLMSSEWAPAAL